MGLLDNTAQGPAAMYTTQVIHMGFNKQFGFTLSELMVTVMVAAILVTVAVPSFRDMIAKDRALAGVAELQAAMNLARSEAAKRKRPISLCKSTNGSSCTSAAGGVWEAGWILFVNSDNDSPPVVDSGEEILRVNSGLPSGGTLRSSDVSAATDFVTFNSRGMSNKSEIFVLCDQTKDRHARALLLSVSGTMRVMERKADGSSLSCLTP